MDMSVEEIAEMVKGTVVGDRQVRITGLNGIRDAGPGELTFLGDQRYIRYLASTRAAAVLVSTLHPGARQPLIHVENPHLSFAKLLAALALKNQAYPRGIHPTAVVADSATLGDNVALDAHVTIAPGAVIGDDVILYAGVYIGNHVTIGEGTIIYPNTTIRERTSVGKRCIIHSNVAIGTDGFGFVPQNGSIFKVPQVGTVIIGDDVEIGSNSAIDRATCGQTRIGRGTKVDNLVQIAHNVSIGEFCTISGGVGIAGSATIGNRVTIGGQAGINGHIDIGDNVVIAGRAGVTKSVSSNSVVSGFPAKDIEDARRIIASQARLPEDRKRLRDLERRIVELEHRING